MTGNDNIQDDFLKSIFREIQTEKTSDDFTHRVLVDIENLTMRKYTLRELFMTNIWYFILALMILIIIAGTFYLSPVYRYLFSVEYRPVLFDIFHVASENILNLIYSVKISSVSMIIVLSVGIVLVADQLLKRPGRKFNLF